MQRKGFTLIELLVVISIISLLSSVVLASLNSAREKGRLAAGKQFDANVYHAEADQAAGLWDFDDCTGTGIAVTGAVDSSGNGNNGTAVNGPLWSSDTPSGKGCSVLFNGTNQYVSVPVSSSLAFSGSMTISLWLKLNSYTSYGGIVGNDAGGYVLYFDGGGTRLRFDLTKTAGGYDSFSVSNAVVTTGVWHHLAVVYDNAAQKVLLYIDGVSQGSAVAANPYSLSLNAPLFIGYEAYGARFTNGYFDSVHLFGKSLSASEVGSLYASEAPRFKVAVRAADPPW